MAWDTVIGLEVHAQLKTVSKLFSGSSTTFGAKANTQSNYIDAGLPGTLPVLNQKAVDLAIRFGLAIDATINTTSIFERKNYFYPDLPKGYQISQNSQPIVQHGHLTIQMENNYEKKIHIDRAHLEEDAGKSSHDIYSQHTAIDLNRAGIPLLEIVSAPCMSCAEEALNYLKTLHQLLRFLDICDGNMQEGSFRCDVNISLKPEGSPQLGTRTEIKNLNSFRFIEKAILYEQSRQQQLLENGQKVIQQTRLFCPDTSTTQVLRNKEMENDYRYFPDPDLLQLHISEDEIKSIKRSMPDLPAMIKETLKQNPEISPEDITYLLSSADIYHFFRAIQKQTQASDKTIINWLKSQFTAALIETNTSFNHPPVSASLMAQLLDKMSKKDINHHSAKIIFAKLCQGENDIEAIIKNEGLTLESDDSTLDQIVGEIIKQHPEQAIDYKNGKEKLLAFFVGQAMKETKGKANPGQLSDLFKKYFKKE